MNKLSTPVAGCMRWGKWGANFSLPDYRLIIDQCLLNGITSFDHADIYGEYTTEAEFGEALKDNPSLRQQMQIISKCGIQIQSVNRPYHVIKSYNSSREHIIESVEQSLRNLNTDYLDVLLLHRPDPLMNPLEIAEAITHLQQQGKVLEFGVSNFLPHHIHLLLKHIPISYNQIEVSLLNTGPMVNGVLDCCHAENIIPMAWAPLGGGILSDDSHPRYRAIAATATFLAEKYETGINQILVAWLMKHPSRIVPVLGTTKLERLLQAKYAADIELSREDWYQLYTASLGEVIA